MYILKYHKILITQLPFELSLQKLGFEQTLAYWK